MSSRSFRTPKSLFLDTFSGVCHIVGMYDETLRQAAKERLEEQVKPLVDAIRAAGFNFPYSNGNSDFGRQYYVYGQIKHPDHRHWDAYIHVYMSITSQTPDKVNVRANYVRGTNWRNWKSALKGVVPKLQESLKISKKAYADAHDEQIRRDEWEEQRAKDFEGWKVPAFLGADEDEHYRLYGLRRDRANPQLGRYCLDFDSKEGVLNNLSVGQVKALCTFLTEVLPNIK